MDLKGFPFDEDSVDVRLVGSRFRDGRHANARDFQLWPFQRLVKGEIEEEPLRSQVQSVDRWAFAAKCDVVCSRRA